MPPGSAQKGHVIMKIQSQGTALVLAKNSREGSNRQIYYNLAVLINNEAGNISCSQEAYEDAILYKTNILYYEYNSEYKSFRVVGIMPADSVLSSDSGQDAGADIASALNQEPDSNPEADKKGSKPDKPGK